MNFFKKNLIAEYEATKQNKNLVLAATACAVPSIIQYTYEFHLRDKVEDPDRADKIGYTLLVTAWIGNLAGLIPSIKYQIRRHKIYKSL